MPEMLKMGLGLEGDSENIYFSQYFHMMPTNPKLRREQNLYSGVKRNTVGR
jgi:hypothetical protein